MRRTYKIKIITLLIYIIFIFNTLPLVYADYIYTSRILDDKDITDFYHLDENCYIQNFMSYNTIKISKTIKNYKEWDLIVPDDYITIQEAIDNSKDGYRIFVKSGKYYENIIINISNIILQGENRENTIIDGKNNGSVIYIGEKNVIICNFTIKNSGFDFFHKWDSGIEIINADNCQITNNNIENNYIGIYLKMNNFCNIKNNIIISDFQISDGIIIKYSFNITINNNIIGSNFNIGRDGIYLENSNRINIFKNKITNLQSGIRAYKTNDMLIEKNYLKSNDLFGINMQYCGYIGIENNIIESSNFGIYFEYIPKPSPNTVFYNDFIKNFINAFYIVFNSGTIFWNGNFWDTIHILPKPIIGIRRDIDLIELDQSFIVNYDFKPSIKRNNKEINLKDVSFYLEKYNKKNLNINFSSNMNKLKDILFNNSSNQKNNLSCNNSKIDLQLGDLLFMDCKRYNPFHSRPGNHTDHVAMYICYDPKSDQELFVDTIDEYGPRICNISETLTWAHNFAYARVNTTNEHKLSAVLWAMTLCLERNKPVNPHGDRIYDNYQYLPQYFDYLGFRKSFKPAGFERYSGYWYCSELVWASYYNTDIFGQFNLFEQHRKRLDLDNDEWNLPYVVLPSEILIDDDITILFIENE